MSIDEICALPVAGIAHGHALVWLWATNAHLPLAFKVLDAWGFQYRTTLTWVKNRIGTGDWLRGRTEHCLLAVRGKPTVQLTNQTTVLHAPAIAHSAKPAAFYEMIEALCPAPRYAERSSGGHDQTGTGTAMKYERAVLPADAPADGLNPQLSRAARRKVCVARTFRVKHISPAMNASYTANIRCR